MTEAQALTLMAQVSKEVPEIITRLINSRPNSTNGYQVKLEYDGRIITAYKPEQWLEIKWVWGLEDTVKPAPVHYQVENKVMTIHQSNGYWYGRYQHNGQSCKYYFGKVDPRPQYQIVEKVELTLRHFDATTKESASPRKLADSLPPISRLKMHDCH